MVDVPLSMLVARVAVQPPRVVLVDADSHGALDVVARMRELPHGDDIPVLFIAAPGGAIASPEEALAHEGSGLFVRPVDLPALVREVEALAADARSAETAASGAVRPDILPPPVSKKPSAPPASPVAGLHRTSWSSRMQDVVSFSSEPPTAASWVPPPRSALVPPVSADLQRLLAEAEQRADVGTDEPPPPSPEQEVEALLPAELLAALDEPLEEELDDGGVIHARSPSGMLPARDRTHDGGGARTTGASGTGSGATPRGTGTTRPGTADELLTPTPAPKVPAGAPPAAVAEPRRESRRDSAAPRSVLAPFAPGLMAPPTDTTFALVGPWNAMRVVARAIASRASGSLLISADGVERRVILREGDVVTCASTSDDESLLSFLGERGELPRETVRRLGTRFPAFGRHAGAALVARGYLRQDQMWPTLRAHAEWLLGRILQMSESPGLQAVIEPQPPGRLAGEPGVFGGVTGAAAFVEVVRRIVAPAEAIERLGGGQGRFGEGEAASLLGECSLGETETELVRDAPGRTLREVLDAAPDGDFATVVLALTQLGVTDVSRGAAGPEGSDDVAATEMAALDSEAIRERVRARLQLVEDGDYFAVLGVPRAATGYEVRRAFLELRRAFDPSRLLSPEVADLSDDVRDIANVLEEAYEILKDAPRRERYRRAIEGVPEA